MDNFDVAIIGGGPGGTAAAGVLASHDKKVAIIEDRDWGGACLNRGCVPTKLFLGAITPLSELDSLGRQRVLQGIETVNFPVLKKRVNAFVEASRRKVANSLIDAGVHLYKGHAYCLTPNENPNQGQIRGRHSHPDREHYLRLRVTHIDLPGARS